MFSRGVCTLRTCRRPTRLALRRDEKGLPGQTGTPAAAAAVPAAELLLLFVVSLLGVSPFLFVGLCVSDCLSTVSLSRCLFCIDALPLYFSDFVRCLFLCPFSCVSTRLSLSLSRVLRMSPPVHLSLPLSLSPLLSLVSPHSMVCLPFLLLSLQCASPAAAGPSFPGLMRLLLQQTLPEALSNISAANSSSSSTTDSSSSKETWTQHLQGLKTPPRRRPSREPTTMQK